MTVLYSELHYLGLTNSYVNHDKQLDYDYALALPKDTYTPGQPLTLQESHPPSYDTGTHT